MVSAGSETWPGLQLVGQGSFSKPWPYPSPTAHLSCPLSLTPSVFLGLDPRIRALTLKCNWQTIKAGEKEIDILRSFLEETKQGRGLKTVQEVLRDAPRSPLVQRLGIEILLSTLRLLKERQAMQEAFREQSHKCVLVCVSRC